MFQNEIPVHVCMLFRLCCVFVSLYWNFEVSFFVHTQICCDICSTLSGYTVLGNKNKKNPTAHSRCDVPVRHIIYVVGS